MKIWKQELSWALYDWGNSAFATTVMAGFFPLFFQKYWSLGADPTLTTARLGVANSLAALAVAILSPWLGAWADRTGGIKRVLAVLTVLGVLGTAALSSAGQGEWMFAVVCFALASVGFHGGCSFYDALLPSVSTRESLHRVSALGYSAGYLGGGVLFTINVFMFLKPEFFGFADGTHAVKFSFLTVAVWWALFALPLFVSVRESKSTSIPRAGLGLAFRDTCALIKNVLISAIRGEGLGVFLIAYWIYIDGVFTVMKMAVDYGVSIGLPSDSLIAALLIVQFVGFPSALFFGRLGELWDPRKAVLAGLVIYGVVIVWAVQMSSPWEFYVMAVMIGLVQGGVQALSRSIFARLAPVGRAGESFGLFNLVGRFAAILGPALMGFTGLLFQDPRAGLLSLVLLFVVGGALLLRVSAEPSATKV
jgi:UMF1 family MFS transporter